MLSRGRSTTNEPSGLLPVFVYCAAVVLSLPASAAVLLLARRLGVDRAVSLVGGAGVVIVAVVAIGVGLIVDPEAGLSLAVYGVGALVVLRVLPITVGRWVVERDTGMDADLPLGYAVAGLPFALASSAVRFVAPGGPTRYILTILTGPALWGVTAVLLAMVLLGPGLVGVGLVRFVRRRRKPNVGRP